MKNILINIKNLITDKQKVDKCISMSIFWAFGLMLLIGIYFDSPILGYLPPIATILASIGISLIIIFSILGIIRLFQINYKNWFPWISVVFLLASFISLFTYSYIEVFQILLIPWMMYTIFIGFRLNKQANKNITEESPEELKTMNKFTKLTFLFTLSYVISYLYAYKISAIRIIPLKWIPDFMFNNKLLFNIFNNSHDFRFVLFLLLFYGFLIASIITGIIMIKQTYKTARWHNGIAFLFTLANIIILMVVFSSKLN